MKLDMVTSQKEMNPTSIGKTKEENFVTGYENILAVEHSSKLRSQPDCDKLSYFFQSNTISICPTCRILL